ncbi:MAG: sulfatase-like hydrolase/transferase [Bacteroidetes bacterium]|nr:sulfatase-like hydrolase/transferase [Bacteroidota bacterium]
MSSKGGVFQRNYELISMLKVSKSSFQDNLKNLGILEYTSPDELISFQGKNVIIISLESFEKGFLSKKNAHLTPYLQQLKSEWNYYNMDENVGAGWTSGSLYAYMTGFPAFFGAESNNIFQGSYYSEVTSLVEVFNKANYETTFITSDAQFSGTEDMLNAFNIDLVIDKTILKERVRDKDLFEVSKDIVSEKSNLDKKFALFISTLDTHFPDGIYDERMEEFVSKRESSYEFMISAVDYMIGEFIADLDKKNLLENTVIYIFPDHLKMGDPSFFDGTGPRGLYLLTNAKKKDTKLADTVLLNQIDLPKVILDGAEIKNNAKFFSSSIKGSKNDFIEKNLNLLTALNISGFHRLESSEFNVPEKGDFVDEYKRDTNRFIAHAGGMIDGYTYTNSLEALNLNYDKGFRFFELDIIQTSDGEFVAMHDWDTWAEFTDYNGELPVNVSLNEFKKHKLLGRYTPIGMAEINLWFQSHPNCTLITDKVDMPKEFAAKFVDKNRLIMELFTEQAVYEAINAGIYAAMPTQGLVESFGERKIEWLLENGIKYIAISRRYIRTHKTFLEDIKKNNIKVYAFHLNFDAGIDENYVVNYEMDYIYGIYADKWSFNIKTP